MPSINSSLLSRHHINLIVTFDPSVRGRNYGLRVSIFLCLYFVQNPLKTCKIVTKPTCISKQVMSLDIPDTLLCKSHNFAH
jgi:hypothetical protein